MRRGSLGAEGSRFALPAPSLLLFPLSLSLSLSLFQAPIVCVQVNDEVGRLAQRLDRLRTVHLAATADPALYSKAAAASVSQTPRSEPSSAAAPRAEADAGAAAASASATPCSAAPAPAAEESEAAARVRALADRWLPGAAHDEIRLSHTAISDAQVAALVVLLTRPDYQRFRDQVRYEPLFWTCLNGARAAFGLRSGALWWDICSKGCCDPPGKRANCDRRAAHAAYLKTVDRSLQVVALWLDGNELTDQQLTMLLRGLVSLGTLEQLHLSHNRLTKVSVHELLAVVLCNGAKHVRPSLLGDLLCFRSTALLPQHWCCLAAVELGLCARTALLG